MATASSYHLSAMSSVPQKIVLKSTTKLSLNDRFSQIKATNSSNVQQSVRANVVAERQASQQSRRLAMQMARRPQVVAALKLKNKSLKQRLGVQARLTPRQPVRGRGGYQALRGQGFQPRGFRGGFRGGYRGGRGTFQVQRGRGTMRAMRSPRGGRPFRGQFRGQNRGQFRGQSQGRGQVTRGRGRGQMRGVSPRGQFRGNRGFRGQRRPGRRGATGRQGAANRESLDADLDSYMAKTKSALDNELDGYMAAGIGQDI